ncbi:hypothetical protein IAG44_24030 [Streptomyces roseirectus]|uniref:Uncharacterized protein n=1 Tax=Streptomyces roseirectus TaxID=2768066 RepID=A0A7H0IHB2_9ACTN|nr:hypothetical protein [Streptomyces roseirectus]QNP72178.1 hypothetical protein IAG44_24030 [Streptomyces roseirectus]
MGDRDRGPGGGDGGHGARHLGEGRGQRVASTYGHRVTSADEPFVVRRTVVYAPSPARHIALPRRNHVRAYP